MFIEHQADFKCLPEAVLPEVVVEEVCFFISGAHRIVVVLCHFEYKRFDLFQFVCRKHVVAYVVAHQKLLNQIAAEEVVAEQILVGGRFQIGAGDFHHLVGILLVFGERVCGMQVSDEGKSRACFRVWVGCRFIVESHVRAVQHFLVFGM